MCIINCCLVFLNDVSDRMVRIPGRAQQTLPPVRDVWQVLASLLVSVLLVGLKLNAAKDIVQALERRKELVANLLLLQKVVADGKQPGRRLSKRDVSQDTG
jgi:hypothetical protein